MLGLIRILLVAALGYGMFRAASNAEANPGAGDLTNAFWLAYCLIVGIFTAIAWVPVVAERVSDPLTGVGTEGKFAAPKYRLMRLIRWLEGKGYRRLARWLCFVEGVRRPWSPAPFVTGMRNARPDSWLEKVYAREVFRFTNAENCLAAYEVLKRHGVPPPSHPNPNINLMVAGQERAAKPPPLPLEAPKTLAPPLKRNRRIQLPSPPE